MVATSNKWNKRVTEAAVALEKVAEKQKYDCSHTADGKKLKKGLRVFALDDPAVKWSISEIEDKVVLKKGIITLTRYGRELIKIHPTKIFTNQQKAINACIKDIKQTESTIMRDMRESLNRLDAPSL